MRRDIQIPTSFAPSRVPPNQADTSPSRVSAIVEACALANGADSKMNSDVSGASVCARNMTDTSITYAPSSNRAGFII
jgi:hypothetical protein